jgi:linoleoyl-CoA desaturase
VPPSPGAFDCPKCESFNLMTHPPTATARPSDRSNTFVPKSFNRKVKFASADGFQQAIKARVDRYFRYTRQSPRDCATMYLKTATILLWFFASWALLVFAVSNVWLAVALAISVGFAIAAVGFNIQHDGGHRAYSRHNWLNRIMGATLDLIGGSSYVWDHKHNTVHHTYANITGHDDDIEVGILARLSPHQPRYKFHRVQHWYLWVLYGLLPLKWQIWDDFYHVARGKIGNHPFQRPKGKELAIFIGGKIAFFSLAIGIPLLFHPFWIVFAFYALSQLVNGVLISIVFQLAHVVEDAQFPMPDPNTNKMDTHWAVHQVLTTVDFSRKNRLVSWFMGGLNFQIEHHLFPRICHIHYRKLSRLVEKTCKDFGIQYNAHRSFVAGVASHYRWLRQMGRPVGA